MEHPAFEEAGSEPGIKIWTIEKFEPVPIDIKVYGKFYNGDSYIVLKTTGNDTTALSHDAHFWLGGKTTQDKMGSAAIWTVTLDDMLGGKAVHHREVQGHESSLFLGYFKPAIRYLEGGNESGFNEVVTNAGAEKRLLKLTGCDNMRIEEVPAESTSLTRQHCFILEVEHDIFVVMAQGAKATQRRKIISIANKLRDEEHNGRATIEIIDEFSCEEDLNKFTEALGGSMDDAEQDDSTEGYARADPSAVYLYRVLVGDELDLVSVGKPYKQSQLASSEIYILDTPCSGVYIWIGSEVDPEVKKSYHTTADKYLDMKGYPKWVNITRVTEGSESSTFKQYFHGWDSKTNVASVRNYLSDIDAGYFSGDSEESAAAAKAIGKSAAARGFMPDAGLGTLEITRIAGEKENITEQFASGISVFYQSEVYVVKYKYTNENGDDAAVIYLWIGADASNDDKVAGYELMTSLEEEAGDNVISVKVPQGKETKHFLAIFEGNLAIVYGSKDNDYKPKNSKDSFDDNGIRLFRVEGTKPGVDMRAVQVPETSDTLEYDDVFVLQTPDAVYVWNGNESSEEEREAALNFVNMVVGEEKEVTPVNQGDEPEEFWAALGGVPEEKSDPSGWKLAVNRRVTTPRTLTSVTVRVTGKIKFEDLDTEFSQQDLAEDGAYILDAGEELYFWVGKSAPERVKNARSDIIKSYIEDDGMERTIETAIVISIKQGAEPAVFKKMFSSWSDDMWENLTSYEDMKNETKASNSQ
ncbi:gelsolin, cytoplasmic [Manduca sexta]|uniref:Gelsolin n=1 Tax=Manduca sexta TaxID=7130 RepID=A0A922D1H6_MANSE|nr:gelsolin, cytoplasmic [Manduca sexta]KAG6464313.1 hypothetical protein O3G_MSEX014432 [Manduca sexta]